MKRMLLAGAFALAAGACSDRPSPLADAQRTASARIDPAVAAALATASPTDSLIVIVSYDTSVTTADALSAGIQPGSLLLAAATIGLSPFLRTSSGAMTR